MIMVMVNLQEMNVGLCNIPKSDGKVSLYVCNVSVCVCVYVQPEQDDIYDQDYPEDTLQSPKVVMLSVCVSKRIINQHLTAGL